MKSLPARPSLDSLRKQAKKLARDVASGDADAFARVRAHLPRADASLTQRNAQLVIAREYGYAGWQDLVAEVNKRVGNGVDWAAAQARRTIHDNDIDRLKQLLAEYPALLSWQDDDDHAGVLGFATGAYGDAFEPNREKDFTRVECAELLIDAGAVVTPSVVNGLLQSRARGLLQLFRRKNLLPHTLEFFAALGDLDAVRASRDEHGLTEAFVAACRFQHEAVASLLLDRILALDPELRKQVDDGIGRDAFTKFFMKHGTGHVKSVGLWKAFLIEQIGQALHDGDLPTFVRGLEHAPWLLDESYVWFQQGLIENAALNDREEFIVALFALDPAILREQPPPISQAIEFAATYAHTHLIPLITRVWPLPDDLPYNAALGNLARVKHWFDDSGAPALGDLQHHYPYNDARARGHLQWDPPTQQQVLDVAFAFAVINEHFDVADFLLAHGADINTNWNSHEPASILHHLVFVGSRASMQYLIDRGIDLSIKDYRWNSTARGWAFYGKNDPELAEWLAQAERARSLQRGTTSP